MFGGFATNVKTTGYELTGDLGKCLRMGGLTFYKDFTKSGSLDADFALGSRKATYTSTSGVPTIGANGYAATTANDDVLKYEIAKNRTAAQETIVIKASVSSVASDGNHYLIATDDGFGGRRIFRANGNVISSGANRQDSNNCLIVDIASSQLIINTPFIIAVLMQHSSPYMAGYYNGSPSGTNETVDDFINNTFVSSFFIGCANTSDLQLDGSIAWVKIFNRALTASEIATLQ